jgi:hypothetical protein
MAINALIAAISCRTVCSSKALRPPMRAGAFFIFDVSYIPIMYSDMLLALAGAVMVTEVYS